MVVHIFVLDHSIFALLVFRFPLQYQEVLIRALSSRREKVTCRTKLRDTKEGKL